MLYPILVEYLFFFFFFMFAFSLLLLGVTWFAKDKRSSTTRTKPHVWHANNLRCLRVFVGSGMGAGIYLWIDSVLKRGVCVKAWLDKKDSSLKKIASK